MVGGAVSSRLLPIFLAICDKTPLLRSVDLDLCDGFVLTKSNSRRSVVNIVDDDAVEKGGGVGASHQKYSSEHHKLERLCETFESTFGLRVFGFKITLSSMLQMFAIYYTAITLVLS
jgi:hypothetical protein